jgi:hypothetical protein
MRWIICIILAFTVTIIDMLTRVPTDDFTAGFGPLELIGAIMLCVIFRAIWWIIEKIVGMFRKQPQ